MSSEVATSSITIATINDAPTLNGVGTLIYVTNQAATAINNAVINGTEVAEIFPDGSRACHQDLPYRPDLEYDDAPTQYQAVQFLWTPRKDR